MGYTRTGDGAASSDRTRRIRRALWIILFLNVAVALAKLIWGLVTGSTSMQADGFHSMFDGTSNVVGLLGIGMASRPADRDHPYGHAKYESYASAVIGAMLLFAAYRIGSTAIGSLRAGGSDIEVTAVSFAVMIGTLIVNLFVTMWERHEGKATGSEILLADASHTASDAMVSISVIIGLIFVRLGYPLADPIVALFVAGAIIYTAFSVFRQASSTLGDEARLDPRVVSEIALSVDGVLGCHHIRSRGLSSEIYVDMHIQVDPSQTVAQGHEIAEQVERKVVERIPEVADVIAHLEPMDDYQQAKTVKDVDAGLA